MKILWLTFIPSPYRLAFFEELGKACELTVLFERENSKTRKSHWDHFRFEGYKGFILKGITIGGYDRLCLDVLPYLSTHYEVIVISNPTSPTGILAAAILKSRNIPYYVESDGAFPTGKKTGVRYLLKKFVMSSAKKCFSTGKMHDEYYIECGVDSRNIVWYPFTSLSEKDIWTVTSSVEENCTPAVEANGRSIQTHKVEQEVSISFPDWARARERARNNARNLLGVDENIMLLYVGRFVHTKGLDILINAVKKLDLENIRLGIYLVGDDNSIEFIREVADEKVVIHTEGFKNKEALSKYYLATDFFILPTREDIWGLVINEALAYSLPVISSDRCGAALELIKDGKNGYLFHSEDVEGLAHILKNLATMSQTDRSRMGFCSSQVIKSYTFENMTKIHMNIFENDLK